MNLLYIINGGLIVVFLILLVVYLYILNTKNADDGTPENQLKKLKENTQVLLRIVSICMYALMSTYPTVHLSFILLHRILLHVHFPIHTHTHIPFPH